MGTAQDLLRPDQAAASGPDAPGCRSTELGAGRVFCVRHATPDDALGLARLYGTLSREDLRYRFCSAYHPPKSFFRRQAGLDGHGRRALVAE